MMIFQASLNESLKSSQELIVLRYSEQQVLIPLPRTFQDIHTAARELFHLGTNNGLRISTEDLHGHAGVDIEINEAAWKAVSPLLRSIIIQPRADLTSGHTLAPVAHVHQLTPSSSTSSIRESAKAKRKRPSRVREQGQNGEEGTAQKRARVSEEPEQPTAGPGSGSSQRTSFQTEEQDPPVEEQHEYEEEEMEINIGEEHGEEEQVEEAVEYVQDHQAVSYASHEPGQPAYWDEPRREEQAAQSMQRRTEQPRETTPVSRKFKPALEAVTPARGTASQLATPRAGIWQENVALKQEKPSPAPCVKSELSSTAPRTQRVDSVPPTQTQTDSTDSFLVQIQYIGHTAGEDEQLMFKTRGRHHVTKVLHQACRTFGIEDLYERYASAHKPRPSLSPARMRSRLTG
ncbi:hypothetical protein OBBRIDRAFT_888416 [Obba rivulosa]|uniref:Uncharacterized protein n=1 Tax=Obba rivulosa TaxID=1052685 RepID=A0A8E2AR45_9APHY|nr:hypothetical protein OBBRIDRAFT_888416 [Obba rivulosa]